MIITCRNNISYTDSTASGLTEDELSASLATLKSLAVSCNADMTMLRKKPADKGFIVECLVRQRASEDDFMEVRYARKLCRYICMYTLQYQIILGKD